MIHDFREGQAGRIDVEIPLDHLQVRGDLAEEFIGFAIGEVSQTENLANLARREELPELSAGISDLEGDGNRGHEIPWLEGPGDLVSGSSDSDRKDSREHGLG